MELSFWPRFRKCCCCLALKTGSLIIGYASLFTSAAAISGVSLTLYKVVRYVKTHDNRPNPEGHSPQEIKRIALSLYISHAYFFLVLLYYLIISLLLVIGVHRNKPKYLRYYCNAALLLIVLASALFVVTLVFFGIVTSIPLLNWCIILFYCLCVVRSTYLEMEESNRPQIYELNKTHNSETQQIAPLI